MQTVKILHTSDWHLGKKLFRASRIEEQKLFLKWLRQTILEQNINVLLISGDIFDSPIPTAEAQETYFQFLKETTDQADCRIYIISGNHDSGRFLEAPLPFLRPSRIEVVGRFRQHLAQHIFLLPAGDKKIGLFLLPHFRPGDLLMQEAEQGDPYCDNDAFLHEHVLLQALERIVLRVKNILQQQDTHFSILMGHHLFGHTRYAGSELFLGLSGLESIPTSIFANTFDYLALGHLHGAQISSSSPMGVYPGSPIPLHFGEDNFKSISILELVPRQSHLEFSQRWLAVPALRMILSITGQADELADKLSLALSVNQTPLPPFIEIRCQGRPLEGTDEARLFEIAKQSNATILKMSYQVSEMSQTKLTSSPDLLSHDFPNSLSLPQVFQAFHRQKYQGAEPSEALMQTFLSSLEEWSYTNNGGGPPEEKIVVDENQAPHTS